MGPRDRLNILANGMASGGRVVLRPEAEDAEGWNALLAMCSKKLGITVTRIFTKEGFEVDMLDEVQVGETLVCSAGEDFAPLLPSRTDSPLSIVDRASSSSSSATLSSSAAHSTPDARRMLSGSSSTAAASVAPPSVSRSETSLSGLSGLSEVAAAPEPYAHLTVLQAAPLVISTPDRSALAPLPYLDLWAERHQLLDTLRESARELTVTFATATTDALRMSCTMGTTILHWSVSDM